MKLNFNKCYLLVCGHKFESMILQIDNTMVIETNLVKLLRDKIESVTVSSFTFCSSDLRDYLSKDTQFLVLLSVQVACVITLANIHSF